MLLININMAINIGRLTTINIGKLITSSLVVTLLWQISRMRAANATCFEDSVGEVDSRCRLCPIWDRVRHLAGPRRCDHLYLALLKILFNCLLRIVSTPRMIMPMICPYDVVLKS